VNDLSSDELVEWFHAFAMQPAESIAAQASHSNQSLLARYVARSLPGHPLGDIMSAEDFAEAVQDIRNSERDWNHALCEALVRAENLALAQGPQAARMSLEGFAASCPWSPFAQVARDQATHYQRGYKGGG
jgi:hypothetical protein